MFIQICHSTFWSGKQTIINLTARRFTDDFALSYIMAKTEPQTCLSHVIRWTLAFLAFTMPVKSAMRFCFSHSWLACKEYENAIHALKTFPRKIGKVSIGCYLPVIWQPYVLRMSCVCILIRGRNGQNNRLAAGASPTPPLLLCARFLLITRPNPPSLSPSSACHAR